MLHPVVGVRLDACATKQGGGGVDGDSQFANSCTAIGVYELPAARRYLMQSRGAYQLFQTRHLRFSPPRCSIARGDFQRSRKPGSSRKIPCGALGA